MRYNVNEQWISYFLYRKRKTNNVITFIKKMSRDKVRNPNFKLNTNEKLIL